MSRVGREVKEINAAEYWEIDLFLRENGLVSETNETPAAAQAAVEGVDNGGEHERAEQT